MTGTRTTPPYVRVWIWFPHWYISQQLSCRRTRAEHLSVVLSTNLGVKFSPSTEIQSRTRARYCFCYRLWRVVLGILVEKSVDRDLTTERKSNKNSSPPTYDSRMNQGPSGGRIQSTDISKTPCTFLKKHFPVDLTTATHLSTHRTP